MMRTTVDLPDDLLEIARSIARGRKQTLSQAVADMMRASLGVPSSRDVRISPVTGLPVIHLGRPTTLDDVKTLEDDD
jgi:hypothetical protein